LYFSNQIQVVVNIDFSYYVQEILAGLQTSQTGSMEYVSEAALLLNADDAELLEAATILHYVGMFVNHKSYHKHSHYLIKV